MAELTRLAQSTDALLQEKHGISLFDLITEERELGVSYRSIALRIAKLTGGVVTVSDNTVIAWHRQLQKLKRGSKKKKGAAA